MVKKKWLFLLLAVIIGVSVTSGILFSNKIGNVNAARGEFISSRWFETTSVNTKVNKDAGDFSIIAMGDQQIAVGNDKKYLEASYDYIAENADSMNLKMFMNLGDLFDVVDFCDFVGGYNKEDSNGRNRGEDPTAKYFWQQEKFVSDQIDKLHNASVPVALTMGNHDYDDMAFNYRINKTFNNAFPIEEFNQYKIGTDNVIDSTHYFGGSMTDDIENAYYFFEGNGQKYMVLSLGYLPTTEIIDWANEIVESNSDSKVIVQTHGYFNHGPNLYDFSDNLWEKFISRHENIFMTLCGHSWVDGGIVKRVDYGINGNPVYQFMINTQGEEFGGLGVFAQMIFRADGTVDLAYYAPAVEKYKSELKIKEGQGMYFQNENQFTFDLNIRPLSNSSQDEIVVGNEYTGTDVFENFASYKSTNDRWLQNVYAYSNIDIKDGKGLNVKNGTGYVVYKLSSSSSQLFKGMETNVIGNLEKFTDTILAYEIDISGDGINYIPASYHDNITGMLNNHFNIDRYVLGKRDLYVKVLLKGNENSYISSLSLKSTMLDTVYGYSKFDYNIDFTKENSVTRDNFDKNLYKVLNGNVYGAGWGVEQVLGSTCKGSVQLRFESPENKSFKNMGFSAVMRVQAIPKTYTFDDRHVQYNDGKTNYDFTIPGAEYGFKYNTDIDYALKIFISTDKGQTFNLVNTINNDESHRDENLVIEQNLSDFAKNQNDIIIRLDYMGINYNAVGFKSINVTADYDELANDNKPNYHIDGGKIYKDIDNPLRDGYVFDGWYKNKEFSGERVKASDFQNIECDLYAKWVKINRVVYILDGGTNSGNNKSIIYEGEVMKLSKPEKNGYIFVGWYNEHKERINEIKGQGKFEIVYAVWIKK